MHEILVNPTEREMLRMRRDALIDWRTEMNAARQEGISQGISQGISLGVSQGISQGKAEMAREMKRDGFDPAVVSRYSGLTLEEINAL